MPTGVESLSPSPGAERIKEIVRSRLYRTSQDLRKDARYRAGVTQAAWE